MNIHQNARLTPIGREAMVRDILRGQTPAAAARKAGVCPRTARKWLDRYRREGVAGLQDRSSRPQRLNNPTCPDKVEHIIQLRRRKLTGIHIAKIVGISAATVSRVLRCAGLSRMKDLEPKLPENRYELPNPGDMIHIDIKRFARFTRPGHRVTEGVRSEGRIKGIGYEYLHVCVDDHSRLAFTALFPNEQAVSAIQFLKDAIAWYAKLGIKIKRLMTDNGSCYRAKTFAKACRKLGIKHIFTKPYTPRTNGKAERFIKTMITEWAYARSYENFEQRAKVLFPWTHMYNWHRPHAGIKGKTPVERIRLNEDNLLRLHT